MVSKTNGKKRLAGGAFRKNLGPIIKRRPNQGLLNFNSWQAQVFIEILGTMLVEQEFIDLVFEPLTVTYAKFVINANRNIWTLSNSNCLFVRVKYRRHAQRLAELLGAILSKQQFITFVLKPIIKTYINMYTELVLGDTLEDDIDEDQHSINGLLMDSDWNCSLKKASTSTPYRRISYDISMTSTLANSIKELLLFDSSETNAW